MGEPKDIKIPPFKPKQISINITIKSDDGKTDLDNVKFMLKLRSSRKEDKGEVKYDKKYEGVVKNGKLKKEDGSSLNVPQGEYILLLERHYTETM